MTTRLELLKRFYGQMLPGKVKLESRYHGFAFLEALKSKGAILEYGQLTDFELVHKYKLANVTDALLDELLWWHLSKECNVCLYFNEDANSVFCLNLDNNHQRNNTELTAEMRFTIDFLANFMTDLGIEPLIIASGRGYHVWNRLEEPVCNHDLYHLMLRISAQAMAALHERSLDYRTIKFNLYPNLQIVDVVSLRLFGSEHVKNQVFSFVWTPEGILDEDASWRYFEAYLGGKTLSKQQFLKATGRLAL